MKSIKQYITESSEDFQKRTLDTAKLITAFEKTLNKKSGAYKDNSISLNNKTELNRFYKDLINTLGNLYPNESTKIIRKFNISNLESFKKFLYENAAQMVKYNLRYLVFKDFNETEQDKEYKKWKNSDDFVESITDEEAKKYDGRVLVIYNRYNPSSHMMFPFDLKRTKCSNHQVNMYKVQFKYETGTNYLDCYPILYTNYIKKGKDLEEYHDVIGEND